MSSWLNPTADYSNKLPVSLKKTDQFFGKPEEEEKPIYLCEKQLESIHQIYAMKKYVAAAEFLNKYGYYFENDSKTPSCKA